MKNLIENLKPLALISISLLLLASVLSTIPLIPTSVSAQPSGSYQYVWLGGYLNTSLALVNLTDGSLFVRTVMNQSLDYWEDYENFTFTGGSTVDVDVPIAGYQPSYSATYSKELSESFDVKTWFMIRLQWRSGEGDGYGKLYTADQEGDVDYNTMSNITGKYNAKGGIYVPVENTGAWIGDDTTANNPARSMWAREMLFINVTMFLGGPPGEHLIALPIVAVPMDTWLTTGSAYSNVTQSGNPLDGFEAYCTGKPFTSDYGIAVFASSGAELNSVATFKHPLSGKETPLNVSYIFAHKHCAARKDKVEWYPPMKPVDANLDGFANVEDLGRMSDYWLEDTTSEEWGIRIGDLEEAGNFAEAYKLTKECNSLDFNGDEFVNVEDLGLLSDLWLEEGWAPPSDYKM